MKIDKDSLIKHHFWYLLGLLAPLVFLALILLWTSTANAIQDQAKKVISRKQELEKIPTSTPKNEKWMAELAKLDKTVEEQKTKIWKESWNSQADIMTWPVSMAQLKDLYFGDRIDSRIRPEYVKTSNYLSQIDEVYAVVDPVLPNGAGAVQCQGSDWRSFLRYVRDWKTQIPTSEEIWLAQEDLWMQRELLRIIHDINESVATFKKSPETVALDKEHYEINHTVFTNPNWRMDLGLTLNDGKYGIRCKLTNISNHRQVLSNQFTVHFRGSKALEDLFMDGEPIGPDKSYEKVFNLGPQAGSPDGIESVKQVLDWRTAPVKKVEKLELAQHSMRTNSRSLKANEFPELKDEAGAAAPPAAGGGDSLMKGSGGPASNINNTVNGLMRDRYVEITPQVRRMAIAYQLVVDQSNIQDVLTGLSNSRLRIQTTQWHWQRYYGDIKPKIDESINKGSEKKKKTDTAPQVNESEAGVGIGGDAGRRGGGKTPTIRSGTEEPDLELVDLCVYGIASLYERYPPKSAAQTADANPKK